MSFKIKSFKHFLTEMPLPKDMDPKSLTPGKGDYNYKTYKDTADKLYAQGKQLAAGSSRAAFHIKVEQSQFKDETDVEFVNGWADTVIKLAINEKGVAQNEEEIKVFQKFKHNKSLLPIIDTSRNHKVNVLLQGKGKKVKTASNWIQMPLAEQIKDDTDFDTIFSRHYGKVFKALQSKFPDRFNPRSYGLSFKVLSSSNLSYIKELEPSEFINETQHENLQELVELGNAGIILGDLSRWENWGVYKNRPVILDYGFNKKSLGLYTETHEAIVTVDDDGNIVIKYETSRSGW